MAETHSILLIQPTERVASRTWSDYNRVRDCLEGVCKIYEEFLKQKSPGTPSITYDVNQLFVFIDQLNDMSMLVYDEDTAQYAPHDKDWIKERIFEMLRGDANVGGASGVIVDDDDDDVEIDDDELDLLDDY